MGKDELTHMRKHRIGEDEEIIGVYGTKGFRHTNFGFILKVKKTD